MRLEERLDQWVAFTFEGYQPRVVRDQKTIHDPLLGTNIVYKHEIAVLDTPLLQRLRHIRQTGLAFLTYPSAVHTRFEHTLGVTVLATRFVDRINETTPLRPILGKPEGNEVDEIRMAAILHDCGHAFLSHASEQIYEACPEISNLVATDSPFVGCEPHEILSYLIVKSPTFQQFFQDYVRAPYPIEIDLDNVADIIIGRIYDPSRALIPHIVNGSFDADKLDYIPRDGYFTGLRLVIDRDRLFYTLSTHEFDSKIFDVVVESPAPLEQILFSKMLLFSTIYHHQKVKACDCMLRGLAEYVKHQGTTFRGSPLVDPVDFLMLTDEDIFDTQSHSGDAFIDRMVANLGQRNLFKRALVICKDTVDNYEEFRQYQLLRLSKAPDELLKLRLDILSRLPRNHRPSIHEVWIDLPELPPLHEEAMQMYVSVAKGEPVSLNLLFPVAGWLGAYADRQWRGHVFCPDHPEGLRLQVHKAARAVLSEYGLQLNEKSRTYCHL